MRCSFLPLAFFISFPFFCSSFEGTDLNGAKLRRITGVDLTCKFPEERLQMSALSGFSHPKFQSKNSCRAAGKSARPKKAPNRPGHRGKRRKDALTKSH